MILVDTSIWIDHLRLADALLIELLRNTRLLVHPFVVGELAVGSLRDRPAILRDLQDLPGAVTANDDEVLRFVEENALFNLGIGYVDAHLLASTRLTPGASLWTRDKRLLAAAKRLALAANPAH